MGYWLAEARDGQETATIKRFDPRFWTVNFPRPMMASVVTSAHDAMRVDAMFCGSGDLAGLIWEAEDKWDHPLLAYATDRDFRTCRLRFRWRSSGVIALDAINGPTLTIEGRTAEGTPKSWYVRLWNYASGTPEDAVIAIDFDDLVGGYLLPAEADPVWSGDIDRFFLSLVPPGYDGGDTPFAAPVEAWVEISDLVSEGSGSTLTIGDVMVPEHGLSIATGYDDAFNQTPARLIRQIQGLGYRGVIGHYVGMSHYFRLERVGDAWLASAADGAVNAPCARWHADYCARAKALDYNVLLALSYELLNQHCPEAWKQRAFDGSPGLTGWEPPSALLSPASDAAMGYLQTVGRAFAAIARDAGLAVLFQIGEPWWWVTPDYRICIYDDAARAALAALTGGGDPVEIASVRDTLDTAQCALLDAAGVLLSDSTAALGAAVKDEAPGATIHLLSYLPTVLDTDAPEARRANLPVGWAMPAFDVLQLEDYDWVTAGRTALTEAAIAAVTARLGYPADEQHYYAGFVLRAEDRASLWPRIAAAADAARARAAARTFVWALPQVARDGFTYFRIDGEDAMQAFDDVIFPIAIGREASVTPTFSTQVVESLSGHEQRSADWADARLRFDAGPGVRSESDLAVLIAFFRARRGAARGFRFADPFDWQSGSGAAPAPLDQALGTGDGLNAEFQLTKAYGAGADAQVRRITRPVAGSIRIAVDGVERLTGWSHAGTGRIVFDAAPEEGAVLTAGFRFDVPVRFAEDRLEINRATFAAGEAPSVPLVEVRE